MPCHSDHVRTAPLPDGYQFGDARPSRFEVLRRFGAAYDLVPVTVTDRSDRRTPWHCPECGTRAIVEDRVVRAGCDCGALSNSHLSWRAPHENAAEQLARKSTVSCDAGMHWWARDSTELQPDAVCLCGVRTWAWALAMRAQRRDSGAEI